MSESHEKRLEQLWRAYESGILDADTYETAISALSKEMESQTSAVDSGAIAQGSRAKAVTTRSIVAREIAGPVVTGEGSIAAQGDVIFAEQGATVVIGEAPVTMTAVERGSSLGRYLQHVISRNRYLQLQGIRSGGRLVHIELDQIYVTLRATTRQRLIEVEEEWLAREATLATGEGPRLDAGRRLDTGHRLRERPATSTEIVTGSVDEALTEHLRLAVLGDPGSGKTTLLRYLALLYARDLAEGSSLVGDKLGLAESGRLPILLPLRQIGAYLRTHRPADDGTESSGQLLEFLVESLKNERIELPVDFFDEWLTTDRAVILLDGLDEVADPDLRRRVSRLVEAFTRAYPKCRYVVTSRIVGYTGPARLGEEYVTTTVCDFSLADVERFLANWHRLVAVGQMGPGDSAEAYAADQTRQLLRAIEANERIRELAINPLMLTVIAMVHRDRVKLPDRRAELYAETVDVLLGKWEEAKGVLEVPILEGRPFDTGDKRLVLQSVALRMHQGEQKEVASENLRRWLGEMFYEMLRDWRAAERAIDRYLRTIEERTGLLVARGEGTYSFSHLTFQEYLAALEIAGRDDYVSYTLERVSDPWWREVILLEAGHLSLLSKERTTRLIKAIADSKEESQPYQNLILAAECLNDVGSNRVEGDLAAEISQRLRRQLEAPPPRLSRWFKGLSLEDWIEQRSSATEVLVQVGGIAYWTLPHCEPEWVETPAGQFWMGCDQITINERPVHRVYLGTFYISRVPITNAQYRVFVEATGHKAPKHWEEGDPPKGERSHPVTEVTWHDALAYCQWLSNMVGKHITLPSEAEWEKAARGDKDRRAYPWGDSFEVSRCNSGELGLGKTTSVGIFPEGASPYGILDLAGNVREWTRSVPKDYPYDPADGRENLDTRDAVRVLRGGDFRGHELDVQCASRFWIDPNSRSVSFGFRVVMHAGD